MVNPANTWATCLTLEQLKAIYGPDSPENLTWNQVDPSFPNQPVVRSMPGADSGTFDYFTEFVNGEVDDSTQFATAVRGRQHPRHGVAGDPNAIGYFGYAYYVENEDKVKAVAVDGGDGCVEPTDATIGDGTYKPLSRPLFIYPNTGKAKAIPGARRVRRLLPRERRTLATEPTIGYVAVPADVATAAGVDLDRGRPAVARSRIGRTGRGGRPVRDRSPARTRRSDGCRTDPT